VDARGTKLLALPVDARIAAVAGAQHGQISAAQLLALGLTRRQIGARSAVGRLHRVYRGVYAVGVPVATAAGSWAAALLAVGGDAALSHRTAGAAHAIAAPGRTIDVTTTRPGAKARTGITVHRTHALDPLDVAHHDGLRVTTPARTLLDLAATCTPRQLDRALNEARVRRIVTDHALEATLRRHPGRPGRPRLAAALAGPFTRSELERRFLALVKAHGLPEPETNRRRHGYELDALWPEHRVVVELDGRAAHATSTGHAADRHRSATLTALGYVVLRFTWWDVTHDDHRVADVLAATLAR